jgi:hypothetical protein
LLRHFIDQLTPDQLIALRDIGETIADHLDTVVP